MKCKLFFLLMLMLPLWSCSQTRLLSSLPSGKDITKVYISPAMMKMAQGMTINYAAKYKDVLKEIKSIEVYSCENAAKCKTVTAEFQNLLKTFKAEEMLYSEEGDELSQIFIIFEKDTDKPKGMLIFDSEPGEVSIVAIEGNIDAAALNISN